MTLRCFRRPSAPGRARPRILAGLISWHRPPTTEPPPARDLMRRYTFTAAALAACLALPAARAGTRGADELFWSPTLEQALDRAAHTGRPIFLVHYTCVGEKSPTYGGKATVW